MLVLQNGLPPQYSLLELVALGWDSSDLMVIGGLMPGLGLAGHEKVGENP